MTLSHCWGDGNFIQLTQRTLPNLVSGVPLKTLPRTFQDAIEITRRLDIQYIWVDSLCIFQDLIGSSEWVLEAQSMDQVYANSYCNFAAHGAQESSKAMLFDRNPEELVLPVLNLPLDPLNSSAKFASFSLVHPRVHRLQMQSDFDDARLMTRAWVVQERFLAPRVLHFSSRQLIWECRSKFAMETIPSGLPDVLMWKNARFKQSVLFQRQVYDGWAFYRFWNNIVEVYSDCNLTRTEDRPIALLGMAKALAPVVNDIYICGMWQRFLVPSLLWRVHDTHKKPTEQRSRGRRRPTFSWTSVDDPVAPLDDESEPTHLIKVLASHVSSTEPNVQYASPDGWLQLQGSLQRLEFQPPSSLLSSAAKIGKIAGRELQMGATQVFLSLDHITQRIPEVGSLHGFYCVPVANSSAYLPRTWLLLLECVDDTAGHFQRIGVAECLGHEEALSQIVQPDSIAADLPCEHFNAKQQLHTFFLK